MSKLTDRIVVSDIRCLCHGQIILFNLIINDLTYNTVCFCVAER